MVMNDCDGISVMVSRFCHSSILLCLDTCRVLRSCSFITDEFQ